MSTVVLRCPNCGSTQSHVGECDACFEQQVRPYCPNHTPGRWLNEPVCAECELRIARDTARTPPPGRTPVPPLSRTPPRAPAPGAPSAGAAGGETPTARPRTPPPRPTPPRTDEPATPWSPSPPRRWTPPAWATPRPAPRAERPREREPEPVPTAPWIRIATRRARPPAPPIPPVPPGDVVAPPRGAGGRSEEERAAAGKKAAWFNTASLLSVALVGAALPPDALFTADWWLAVGAVVTGLFGLVRARWLGGRGRTLSRFALLGGLGLSIAGPIANPAPLPEWAVDLGARVGLPVGLPPQVTRGIEAYRAGDRERAKREFTEAAQLYPRSAVALVYLARMRRQDGDADGGAELLRTALARDPEAGVIHHDLGTYHIERARRYQARGETRYADQEYEEAGRYLSTALRINPSYASASGYIACALVGLGRTQEAEYYASRAGDGPWRACLAPAAPTPAAPPLSPGRPRGGAR